MNVGELQQSDCEGASQVLAGCFGDEAAQSRGYWLTALEDRNGNRITFSRRPDGTPTAVTHDGGYTLRVTTDTGRVQALHLQAPDALIEVRTYGYDEAGLLSEVVNESGLPLRLTYDQDGRITSWRDRNDSTFRYIYDDKGRITATAGPDGILASRFAYDEHPETGHRVTRYTDSTGATTVFQMNDALQVVAETDPLGHTTRFEFDAHDELTAQTDALGHTVRFERDEHGNLAAMTAADGVRTTALYNQLHLPVEITERGGITRRFAYDERGNRTLVTEPDGSTTHFAYDEHGHLVRVVNAVGAQTVIRSDRAGLPLEITAPDEAGAVFTRDAFGRVVTATDAVGGTLRQGWTVAGRPAWRELPDGTREEWTWDPEGNLATHTDRMGRTTTHSSTHFDLRAGTRTADGADHRFTHDTELRLTTVTNAQGLEWNYTYDAAGRLVAETDFDGRTLTYEHDALGRLTRRTNAAGQSLTYERDTLGRVIRLTHDDDTATVLEYDETGTVVRITNPHADIVFTHDEAGRTTSETVNGRTLTHAYDPLGRRTHRRTPSGATSTLEYGHDGLTRYQAGDHTFHFTRDALGRETTRTLGALTLQHTWDPVGRVTHQNAATPSTSVLERTATYQADGTPVHIGDSRTGQRDYTLDPAGRITAVHADDWTEQYAYNMAGDLTHADLPPRAPGHDTGGERHYTGSRLTRAGRTTYTYDAQGRITQRHIRTLSGKTLIWRFTWNAEDRLTRVTTPTGDRWTYLYDGLGRRIAKHHTTTSGQTTASVVYTWDGGQIAEQDDGTTTLSWDCLGLQPLAQREARADGNRDTDRRFFAIVADLTGSPSELLTPDGDIAWKARTTAWGATQWNRSSTAYTPLRQPGQYFDPETGLHYNVNRYYDPDLGRYLTPDPLGIAPAINHYAYVPNPFTLSDPLGLAGCEADPTWGGRVTFTRDQHGRPYEMNATITRDMLDEGTDARDSLRPPGFINGNDHNQARGHMLARRLGGSGDTLDNLFTITQNPTNSPEMRDWERDIYNAVKKEGVVSYSVYLEYTDDKKDSIPKYIQLEAYDRKGNVVVDTMLDNPAHAKQQNRRRLGL